MYFFPCVVNGRERKDGYDPVEGKLSILVGFHALVFRGLLLP